MRMDRAVSWSPVSTPAKPFDRSAEEPEAFATAFAEHAPALLAWASCRVRGELRARLEPGDLVQEVGVRACSKFADFDPRLGNFRQWLFGFANRVWLEALREIDRDPLGGRRRHGGDTQLQGVPAAVTSISRACANLDALRACRRRLDELDEDDRRLLTCIGLEGLSHAEAAVVLGIREDTCRKRWQRLRDRLQDDAELLRLLP